MKGFVVFVSFFMLTKAFSQQPAELANPLVATTKPRFDFFAAASLPYGMVALSPDTHHGDLWNAGYRYNDGYVFNFSHVHNTQTAGIPVMPVTGASKALQGLEASRSKLSHEGEIAKPGYHKLILPDYGITAELTSSLRAGFHRYTFPAAKEAHIIMDLTAALGPVQMVKGYAKKISNTEIEGYSVNAPTFRRKKNSTVYFVARFSKPFDAIHFWKAASAKGEAKELVEGNMTDDRKAGVYASYLNLAKGEQVMVQVGISFVSMENARMNLEKEMPDWNFEQAVARAKKTWNDYLGRIEVNGGTKKQQVKFYTDLMHTAIGRRISEDVNGAYTDNTGNTPVVRYVPLTSSGVPSYHFLDADGLWGSHWNLNILWSMVYPEYGNDLAKTFLTYYQNTGIMGRTSWGGQECWVMVGDQTVPLLSALLQTNRATFNKEQAFAGAYKNAFPGGTRDRAGYEAGTTPKGGGIDWYLKYGYVPIEIRDRGDGYNRGGASMTLEYAYQDWCIANMATTLNKNQYRSEFMKRAGYWKNIFDSSVGYTRPKDTLGRWLTPFEPVGTTRGVNHATPGFIESNAAIYSYYVPQDLKGLIKSMGGNNAFIKRLNTDFENSVSSGFAAEHGEHYAARVDYDNQPGCHMGHLFSHAGAPWLTQYWIRQVKENTFGDTSFAGGYRGDEDQGQMGALSTLMAIGLFDVQGLADVNPTLEITSPVFNKITFHLPGKKIFVIQTSSPVGKDNTYIQSVQLNGKPWNNFELPFSTFASGGSMKIELGPTPNKAWGTGLKAMAAKPVNYYVDPIKGNDISHDGSSITKAFKTIEKARDAVRTMHASMNNDINVYLRGGVYWLKSTLLFDTSDAGNGGFNIIYSAYKNEKPVISGGKEIKGWTLYDSTKKIYRAYAGKDLETRQLFVNGIRAIRARSTVAPSPLTFKKEFGYITRKDLFANSPIPMQRWKNQADIEFVFKNEWTAPRIGISAITNNDSITTISMKQPGWGFVTNKGGTSVGGNHNANGLPWYIENAYELLDEEAEWYLDRATGFIYYKPRAGENMTAASVVVPVLEELIRIQGTDAGKKVSHIQFKGLTFSHATYLRVNGNRGLPDAQNNVMRDDQGESIINAAVNLKYASAIKFERVVFEHLGANGLNMYSGSQDNLVTGCVFTDISGTGIQVGDYTGMFTAGTENYILNTDSLLWLRNNDVYNSYFNKTGAEYFSSTAIAATLPVDMDIVHNEISNTPYSAIHIGWGWDKFSGSVHQRTNIQYNYIHDIMTVLRDGGAIYTLGPTNGSATNKGYITNNYIQNVNNQFGALYADEGSSWFDLSDNVINNSPRYAHIWTRSIHDININNNYTTTLDNTNKGIKTSMTNATLVTNGNWPSAAVTIMDNAGLEKTFLDIKQASANK